MNKVLHFLLIVSLFVGCMPANAQFSLDKYRIVLKEGERRTDLRLYNTGTEFSSYRVQLVDMEMGPDGILKPTESFPYSAKKLLRVGPRLTKNVTPNSYQKIRVRARGNSEAGEFRSHLLIEELLAPFEGDVQGMVVRPNLKVIIPIFVVSGEQHVKLNATDFDFKAETGELTFALHREGNSSGITNIVLENSKGEMLYRQNGVGIYREVNQRSVVAELPETIKSVKGLVFKMEQPDSETILFQRSL